MFIGEQLSKIIIYETLVEATCSTVNTVDDLEHIAPRDLSIVQVPLITHNSTPFCVALEYHRVPFVRLAR